MTLIKLMDTDSDALGMPQTEYEISVTTASNEFTRIVRHNLSQLGDSVHIGANKVEGLVARLPHSKGKQWMEKKGRREV